MHVQQLRIEWNNIITITLGQDVVEQGGHEEGNEERGSKRHDDPSRGHVAAPSHLRSQAGNLRHEMTYLCVRPTGAGLSCCRCRCVVVIIIPLSRVMPAPDGDLRSRHCHLCVLPSGLRAPFSCLGVLPAHLLVVPSYEHRIRCRVVVRDTLLLPPPPSQRHRLFDFVTVCCNVDMAAAAAAASCL